MEEERKWLKTRFIIEIVGKPIEHIGKAIVMVGESFGKDQKEVKVTKRSVREPVQLPDSEFFSAYVEFEADVKDISTVMGLIFDYMPSSVEIIEPETLVERTPFINSLLNDLAERLHQYDHHLRELKAQNELYKRTLKDIKKKVEDKKASKEDTKNSSK